ncbi:Orotidine 5'-phosphate decarboxylase [Candidatus Kinetoplastibacterium sorsogonicusi]|uniref:Orotidine-5'-phosphate decarboxylase n=1 Tax=Candidatus Kinetoplastidibacterium kentomonadis TaxID=1576550 RepID=A0A3Q8ER88_9PROT|nr:orotidine-5'-phosphate decarboxylase [Candidatus Kinetoplastibacterium sorsogonicusi]AWD32386.1 Orotidine 5'-phosphate decarboxylase [Candidatus Kinetoplastibacterium sorsogonicusi]
MDFYNKLTISWKKNNSLLVVGLDPEPSKFPKELIEKKESIFEFCKCIVDATNNYVCGFKIQIAYFSAYKAENQLEKLCNYIKLNYPELITILDAKRGDIGHTSEKYAQEIFERYEVDSVTVNPYMGLDAILPFLNRKNKGVIILCKTSNKSSKDFQELILNNGNSLYLHIADTIAKKWNYNKQCALVVGATFPNDIKKVRDIVGEDMPLLIPGIGAQGGNLESTINAGINKLGSGILINSSRNILYPYIDNININWMQYSADQAKVLNNKINSIINDSFIKK